MKNGFIKCAACAVEVTVADTVANTEKIKNAIDAADAKGVALLVLPELCITGYTCGDLFLSDTLLESAKTALADIAAYTAGKYPVTLVGLPVEFDNKLYNCAAVIFGGEILGIVPKTAIPNYSEFYEKRYFESADNLPDGYNAVEIGGDYIPFSKKLIFKSSAVKNFKFGVEICEDLWGNDTPSRLLCQSGAMIIANLSASDEVIGKSDYRRTLVSSASARYICGYIYSDAAESESTQDMVYGRHMLIGENGTILAENMPFGQKNMIITEIDVDRLCAERRKNTSYLSARADGYTDIFFSQNMSDTLLTRKIEKNPFVPSDKNTVYARAASILEMQSYGLKKRLEHTRAKTAGIGISGGLDSCLALLVAVNAMDLMKRDRHDVIAVTMPCFGTTKRTHTNAEKLCRYLGVTFREINIKAAVNRHFKDIGHDENVHDITYENSQARERTQILMDLANEEGGMVIGTGDLSELALGWATYNGDHMSMYGVNVSVPKTLVRYVVRHVAEKSDDKLKATLLDILDTPVSPELLPADKDGNIVQKTEEKVGPYELHDFYLYYMLRFGFSPSKIYRLAKYAFEGEYSDETILEWLRVFIKRFFAQQFKRSCLPDGVKVGSVTLSPRGDWRMPSDAVCSDWLRELDELK